MFISHQTKPNQIHPLQLRSQVFQLGNYIDTLSFDQEVLNVRQCPHLHLFLRIPCLGPHVREKRGVWKVEEPRVDRGFVGIHIQTDSTKLVREFVSNSVIINWI